jgi:glycine cleavage system H protein
VTSCSSNCRRWAVNDALTSAPEQVNSDPHAAWIIRVRPTTPADLDSLLDADAYTQHVG